MTKYTIRPDSFVDLTWYPENISECLEWTRDVLQAGDNVNIRFSKLNPNIIQMDVFTNVRKAMTVHGYDAASLADQDWRNQCDDALEQLINLKL